MFGLFRGKSTDRMHTSALEQAIDAVVIIDESNDVVFYNSAAERLWGYSAAEVVGNNVKIQNNVSIYPGTYIEDEVFVYSYKIY